MYATLDEITATRYDILLTSDPNCDGIPECEVGEILSQPGSIAFERWSRNLRRSERVKLADGTPAVVGISAYRARAVATWIERSRTYVLELYVRTYPADLLTTADSMTTY